MQEHSFETVRPYVINFLKKNYWKLDTYMDWDDAMAEAQLQFVRTIKRLQSRGCVIENEKHLMSLFKTSWSNHFITLSNKATKERIFAIQDAATNQLMLNNLIGDLDNDGMLKMLLQQAPGEVKQVLRLLLTAPDELVANLQKEFKKDKALCNQHLCLLLNKNSNSVNLVQNMLDYLGID